MINIYPLLKNASSTGPGPSIDINGRNSQHFTATAKFVDDFSSVTAVTVAIEGTIDFENWYSLATHPFSASEMTAKKAMFHIVDKLVAGLRANVTVFTGAGIGNTITVQIASSK